jgi:hypothetical protein
MGNHVIGNNLDPEQKRKRPWKKVKSGGSDPGFSAFSRPTDGLGRSRPSAQKACLTFFHGRRVLEKLQFGKGGSPMPIVKKQAVIVPREIRIESSVGELLDDYAKFIDSSPDHVVNSVLKKLWRDPEYRKWRDERRTSKHSATPAADTTAHR